MDEEELKATMLDVGSGGNAAQTGRDLGAAMQSMRSGGTPMVDPFAMVQPVPYIPPGQEVSILDRPASIPMESYDMPGSPMPDVMPEELMVEEGMQPGPMQPVQPQQPADQQLPSIAQEGVPGGPPQRGGRPFQMDVSAPNFNERYRYTQQDFYGGDNPNITWTDPRGVQMYVPKAGELPMAIWASRMQQNASEKQAIKDRINKLREQEIAPTADPYQQSFSTLIGQTKDNFVSALAESYGGNEDLAWKEIATDGTDANRRWMQMHKDLEALGQYGKFLWADAKDVLDMARKNEVSYTEETMKQAEEIYYGLGNLKPDASPADIRRLVETAKGFTKRIGMEQYSKNSIEPNIKEKYQRWHTVNFYRDKATGMKVEEIQKKYNGEAFLKGYAKEYARLNPQVTEQEAYDFFSSTIPKEHLELAVDSKIPPIGGSGLVSGGAGTVDGRVVRADYRDMPEQVGGMIMKDRRSIHLSPFQVTGGKEHAVKEMDVSIDGTSNGRPMRNVQLLYNPGSEQWELYGKMLDEGGVERLQEIEASTSYDTDGLDGEELAKVIKMREDAKNEVYKKHSKATSAPADFNTSLLESYWGDSDPNYVLLQLVTSKGGKMSYEDLQAKLTTKDGRDEIARILGAAPKRATPAKAAASSSSQEMVTVRMPDGKTGQIPAANLDAFMKKYPTATQVK